MVSPFTLRGIKAFSTTTSDERLDQWERDFRAAARADHYADFRAHMRRLGLPNKPRLLLEGTVRVVRMCSVYASIDGRNKAFYKFLERQRYHASDATEARYVFTFDIFGVAFARVLATAKDTVLDLADLYNSPWNDFERVGFHQLWISRLDGGELTRKDIRDLEREVTNDLRYDYTEDELNFWFDDSLDESYLFVGVQDVSEEA